MTALSSRTHPRTEAGADCPQAEQIEVPTSCSLSSLTTLWIPPDAVAQTWGQLGAEAPTAPIFFVCALAFQGLASEASALHHYTHAQKAKGRVSLAPRHLLLHTTRELTDACRAWDGVVGWLNGRQRRDLPLSDAARASLISQARAQVTRLWRLQGQVQAELVQVCLQAGLPQPRPSATPFVPSSLSATSAPDEEPAEPPEVVLTEEVAHG